MELRPVSRCQESSRRSCCNSRIQVDLQQRFRQSGQSIQCFYAIAGMASAEFRRHKNTIRMPNWPPQLPAAALYPNLKIVGLATNGAMFKIARSCKTAEIDNPNSNTKFMGWSEKIIFQVHSLVCKRTLRTPFYGWDLSPAQKSPWPHRLLSFALASFHGLGCGKFPISVRLGTQGTRMQFASFLGRCTTSRTRHG